MRANECYLCKVNREDYNELVNLDDVPLKGIADATEIIAQKLMQFRHADVTNLSKLIASYLDPNDYNLIKYNSDIPNIADILHDSDTYSSGDGMFVNHSGILNINLEYKCNCRLLSSSINILPRGSYIGRIYVDSEGNIIIDTFTHITLPKKRLAVMASTNGVVCVPAKILRWRRR